MNLANDRAWMIWNIRHAPRRLFRSRQNAAAMRRLVERQRDMFFLLGTGRSGTELLTALLSKADAMVLHEPDFKGDVATMEATRASPAMVETYWRSFRGRRVGDRWRRSGAKKYGEVTGTIRYHAPVLAKLFPQSPLLQLTRDGRGYVRSLMGWPHFYGPRSKGAYALHPLPGDPFLESWPRMSRFERICWAWSETNEFLMQVIPESDRVALERIVSDRDYFEARVAGRLGLHVPAGAWEAVTGQRSANATTSYDFPDWPDWTSDERDAFKRICGSTMERLGYEF